MKRLELVFKILANENRLKIIKMLYGGNSMNVTEITDKLGISFMAVSRHLVLLRNFEVLISEGKKNHVVYSFNKDSAIDIKKILKTIF